MSKKEATVADSPPSDPQTTTTNSSQWSTWNVTSSDWNILLVSTVIKLLLYPSYRSTDFEVHRNWLAITHSLPISKWYYDTTSEWTLDYPPFFAYFEWLLSIPAYLVDPKIVDLNNINYDSWSVIAYQRTTVIITELVLATALLRFVSGSADPSIQRVISAALFLHPGFLIVDHIHFQYNGFMFGILLWSILMARNGNRLASGILFAILLNFKHIYMYLAPAYFVYLLRAYCLTPSGRVEIKNFLSLANAVIGVFVASLGPFALMGQIPQLLSRLFPFTRGLNHAYWAPNFWALVTALDRIILRLVQLTGTTRISVDSAGVSSSSRGLVGDTVFAILPQVKPIHTFIITLLWQAIVLIKLWKNPSYKSFLTALTLSGWASFLFGWHVHEKAVLLILVPLSLLAAERHAYFRTFLIASTAGIFALFPLLFTPSESVIKVVYSTVWIAFVYGALNRRVYEYPTSPLYVVIDALEKLYLAGFPCLLAFTTGISLRNERISASSSESSGSAMEFLPLMVTSIYCAIGMLWSFLRLGFIYFLEESDYQGQLSAVG
ncbi:glucosyltransferase [Coprinopsis marcescibilis]|uniref:Alpha-1,3-glucosyltransferase n=1 Tax=Coprinopsis marcescibilis TaxID=230819 RepID=A0A5C3L830_COPMA|nr:glucosyltransferase [Coprinopsis marcescibilis]